MSFKNPTMKQLQADLNPAVGSNKLTPAEENALLIAQAKTGMHSELSFVTYYLSKGLEDAAKRSLTMAWEWYKRLCQHEATLEQLTSSIYMQAGEELGTHTIISGGEVIEFGSPQWFDGIEPIEF